MAHKVTTTLSGPTWSPEVKDPSAGRTLATSIDRPQRPALAADEASIRPSHVALVSTDRMQMSEGQRRARAKALATGPLMRPAAANSKQIVGLAAAESGPASANAHAHHNSKFRAPESTEESALAAADQYDAPASGGESRSLSPPSGRHGDCSSASLLRTSRPASSAASLNSVRCASSASFTSAIRWHLLRFAQSQRSRAAAC